MRAGLATGGLDPFLSGVTLFAQCLVLDAAAPESFSLSDALTLTICD